MLCTGWFILNGILQYTVWSSDLYTLLMRYEVNLTPYCIKSVYKSLNQTVENLKCQQRCGDIFVLCFAMSNSNVNTSYLQIWADPKFYDYTFLLLTKTSWMKNWISCCRSVLATVSGSTSVFEWENCGFSFTSPCSAFTEQKISRLKQGATLFQPFIFSLYFQSARRNVLKCAHSLMQMRQKKQAGLESGIVLPDYLQWKTPNFVILKPNLKSGSFC